MTKIPVMEADRTVIGHRTCVYDAWNRLVKVQTDASTPADLARMTYDGRGRRIKKVVTISGDWNCTYHYYYNGHQLVETRDGSDDVLKQHVWGIMYVDELLQIGLNLDPTAGDEDACETFYYAAHDAQFSVTMLFEADGTLAERYAYTPYGRRQVYQPADGSDDYGTEAIPHSQPWVISTVDQPYGLCDIGHQGLVWDKEIGLIYNRARYLEPDFGRFISRDPLGYVDGMSLYEYCGSCPVALLDPSGTDVATPDDSEFVIGSPGQEATPKPFPDPGLEEGLRRADVNYEMRMRRAGMIYLRAIARITRRAKEDRTKADTQKKKTDINGREYREREVARKQRIAAQEDAWDKRANVRRRALSNVATEVPKLPGHDMVDGLMREKERAIAALDSARRALRAAGDRRVESGDWQKGKQQEWERVIDQDYVEQKGLREAEYNRALERIVGATIR